MTHSLSLTAGLVPPRQARDAKHYTHDNALSCVLLARRPRTNWQLVDSRGRYFVVVTHRRTTKRVSGASLSVSPATADWLTKTLRRYLYAKLSLFCPVSPLATKATGKSNSTKWLEFTLLVGTGSSRHSKKEAPAHAATALLHFLLYSLSAARTLFRPIYAYSTRHSMMNGAIYFELNQLFRRVQTT